MLPIVEVEPPIVHGVVESDGLRLWTTAGGLSPSIPSSVEPSGMPTGEIVPVVRVELAIVPEVVGAEDELPILAVQLLDVIVDVVPPPSNDVEDPLADEDVMPVDVVGSVMPVAAEVDCSVPEQVVSDPPGMREEMVGLNPNTGTLVVPSGSPVGATGDPEPVMSGEVTPRGVALGVVSIWATCANAEPQHKNTAIVTVITKRCMARSTSTWIEFGTVGPTSIAIQERRRPDRRPVLYSNGSPSGPALLTVLIRDPTPAA